MFGRKWTCNIANDNGRTGEFIKKRTYPDKTRCYECGGLGHLSYKCPSNTLGDREPPQKRKKRRKVRPTAQTSSSCSVQRENENETGSEDEEEEGYEHGIDSLADAIKHQVINLYKIQFFFPTCQFFPQQFLTHKSNMK